MRVTRRVTGFAVAMVAALSIVTAAPAGALTVPEKQQVLYRELASVSVFNSMYATRTTSPNNEFNWTTDLCSWSPDNPFGFNFSSACRRHDFNYRNFKDNSIWNTTNKGQIDTVFYNDMKAICVPYSWFKEASCKGLAGTYYNAVRSFGT